MAAMPLVSIMMPAWNSEQYILEAIQSCQMQTYLDWELCIVDDGSDDRTHEIACEASWKDTRIRVDKQWHQGCPQARNASLAMMNGDIIARQDADDLQDPTRLEKSVDALINQDIDIVTTKMYWLRDGRLRPQPSAAMDPRLYMEGRGGRPVNASIVTWKNVYGQVGGFKENQPAGSDGDWNFRAIIAHQRWGFINEPLYIYRRHPNQITKRLSRAQRDTHNEARRYYYKRWTSES